MRRRSLLALFLLASSPASAGPLFEGLRAPPHSAADPPPIEGARPPSPRLHRALELYDQEHFAEALPLLVAVDADEHEQRFNRQRATFFVGKAQFNLQHHELAAAAFARIIDEGPAHPYFRKTLPWMASYLRINGDAPEPFPILARIAKFPDEVLDDPHFPEAEANQMYRDGGRDEVLYRVGVWCRAHGQTARADKLWSMISPTSAFSARVRTAKKRK